MEAAEAAAAAIPSRAGLATSPADMVRLDAETKQITHAIRMAACNAEIILARALWRRALCPRPGRGLRSSARPWPPPSASILAPSAAHPVRPAHRPRRTQALARPPRQLNQAGCTYPGTDLARYEVKRKPCLHDLCPMSRVLWPVNPRGTTTSSPYSHTLNNESARRELCEEPAYGLAIWLGLGLASKLIKASADSCRKST